MKKVFLTLVFLSFSICYAQEHMTFLGVSMNKTISSFQQEMTKKGFRFIENLDQNTVHMKGGSFAGKENANLLISCTPKSKKVAVVIAWFNDYKSDDHIKDAFKLFLLMYQRKYGDYERVIQDDNYVYKFDSGIAPIALYMNPISYGIMSGCFFRYGDPKNCVLLLDESSDGI